MDFSECFSDLAVIQESLNSMQTQIPHIKQSLISILMLF